MLLAIKTAVIAGFDWGARSANIVAALWPERVSGLVSVSGYLIGSQEAGKVPLPPEAELQWWYQYYFATERGRAGYDEYRHTFARLIWHTASPKWSFDDETFDRSAASFDNPDHVAIVTHNYRWRLGLAEGEADYSELEMRLAKGPEIPVPTITLEGDANGAPHPEPGDVRNEVLGAVRAPDDRGRHRAQPPARGPGGVRRCHPRGRRDGCSAGALTRRALPVRPGRVDAIVTSRPAGSPRGRLARISGCGDREPGVAGHQKYDSR